MCLVTGRVHSKPPAQLLQSPESAQWGGGGGHVELGFVASRAEGLECCGSKQYMGLVRESIGNHVGSY